MKSDASILSTTLCWLFWNKKILRKTINVAKNSIWIKIFHKSGKNHVTSIDLDTQTSLDQFSEHLSMKYGQQKLVQFGTLEDMANLRSSIRSKIS